MKPNILFVSHKKTQCGVYEFGKSISSVLEKSAAYTFIRTECDSLNELEAAIAKHQPSAVIYNYNPWVLPWICSKITKGVYRNNLTRFKTIHIGIIHEVTQEIADMATGYMNSYILGRPHKKLNSLFNYYIAADPTLLLKNPLVFKTGRLIPQFQSTLPAPAIPTIGSFGFGTPKKGFQRLVSKVQEEFDQAIIRINMPGTDFGDKDSASAKRIADECRQLITKPGIELNITHDYLGDEQLLSFLGANSMNVFMYEDTGGRGISSAVDNALAVKRPVAVSRCPMFRHILSARPSVCVDDQSLKTILANGFAPLEQLVADWNQSNLCWEYERILNRVLAPSSGKARMGIKNSIISFGRRIFSMPDKSFTWLRNTDSVTDDDLTPTRTASYSPVQLQGNKFNRILDNQARELYKPTIDHLFGLVPKTMNKKIVRANVQQAFIFDTVYRHLNNYASPKLLCVGSYEDTASMGLQKMGYSVEDVDPMVNYFIQEFYTKPSTERNTYDIIFSTSVIEHDPDDESFIKCVAGLLSPGGIAAITCDYKDGWKPGDLKPDVDARFYTKKDLGQRLLSCIPDCELVDEPNWDCPNPDFILADKYQYTFAGFVVKKRSN